jgi:hypothetical protein
MGFDTTRVRLAFTFAGAGIAWPTLHCALTEATMTPLQRALSASWCGAGPQTVDFLGHTATCWVSAVAFFLAAALLIALPRRISIRAEV